MTAKLRFWNLLAPCVVAAIGLTPVARAQSGPTSSEEGPTREAQASTARDYLGGESSAPRFMPRYLAFQRDFVSDFGTVSSPLSDRIDPILGLQARLEQRWGDTAFYRWLERGLMLYAHIQASTRTERRGFDIKVRTDDMVEGKLGVRMSRPLGSGAVE